MNADTPDADNSHPMVEPLQVTPGELIGGRYRVETLIAQGGQAAVWLASQEPLERPVALKILTPPQTREDSEPFQERFLLEARTLASLTHPNIVVVYDYGEVRNGHYYIAMEYIEGVRFSEILRLKPRNIRRNLRLIFQVCKALRYAHNRGVIHRDVKNANILVHKSEDEEELVKVVDFGIVKLQETGPGITQEGVVLGSPHFMAPEQIRGEAFDHRADIYAVGVLMYCACIGKYPFRGRTPHEIMRAHLVAPIPTLKIKNDPLQYDEDFKGIIQKALAKDPDQRYQFMDDLMEALQKYAELPDLTLEELEKLEHAPTPTPPKTNTQLTDEATVQEDMNLHRFHDNMSTEQLDAIADDYAAEIVDPTNTHTQQNQTTPENNDEESNAESDAESCEESNADASDADASDADASDAEVSDAEVSDAEVSDAEVSDAAGNVESNAEGNAEGNTKVSDAEDAKSSDADANDADASDADASDTEASDTEASDTEVSDTEVSDAEVSDAEGDAESSDVEGAEGSEESSTEGDAGSDEGRDAVGDAEADDPDAGLDGGSVQSAVISTNPPVMVNRDEAMSRTHLMKLWVAAFMGTLLLLVVLGWAGGLFSF